MWILPDQKLLKFPKSIVIDGIRHPKSIFTRWSKEKLAAIGIKPFIEDGINDRFYKRASTYTEEIDGVVYKRWEVVERYTVEELKIRFNKKVVEQLKDLHLRAKSEVEFLSEFDPFNVMIGTLNRYMADLKTAYRMIRAEARTITDYSYLIEYQWESHYPQSPFEEIGE